MPATPLQEQEWISNEICPDVCDLMARQHRIPHITGWMKLKWRKPAINADGKNLSLAMESCGRVRSRHCVLAALGVTSRLPK
jgi:hypothetical protein